MVKILFNVGFLLLIKRTEFLYAIMFIMNWSMIHGFTNAFKGSN